MAGNLGHYRLRVKIKIIHGNHIIYPQRWHIQQGVEPGHALAACKLRLPDSAIDLPNSASHTREIGMPGIVAYFKGTIRFYFFTKLLHFYELPQVQQ